MSTNPPKILFCGYTGDKTLCLVMLADREETVWTYGAGAGLQLSRVEAIDPTAGTPTMLVVAEGVRIDGEWLDRRRHSRDIGVHFLMHRGQAR